MRPRFLFVSLLILFALWCTTAAPAQSIPQWQPNTSYAVGALVMYNGVEYQCIQAHTSEVGWEPPNTPALWQPVSGGGGSCSSVPSAPTGLAASSTTSSGTSLSWSAVSPPANCTITNYTVYQNGNAIGTTTSTSFAVTGLSPSTTYTFTVAASDAAGMSGQSSSVQVTTSAGSGGGGGGSGCAPAWSSSQVYTGGMTASENGINYVAEYWTLGQDPATNNGPAGSGQPWRSQGSCGSCSTIPSIPTNLNASGTNSTSTTLNWTASSAAGCTITGYTIFENGNAVGSSTGTTFVVNGLSAQTTYTFTVAAVDSAGTSPQSAAIQVTTSSGGGGGGGGGNMFAPYMDISLGEGETVASMASQAGLKAITLAFLVDGGCVATWGGLGGNVNNATFPNGTTVASAINALEAEGVSVIISWGGANGSIQNSCTTASQVQAMYQSVFDAYPGIIGQDFDIEGTINNSVVAQALAGLKAANPGKLISLTLPVLPTGLVSAGINILDACASAGFNPDVVNVMAMDYGSANDNGGQMGLDATDAASATETQIHQAGLSSSVGVTPMIGVNDTNTEIFQLSDANTLVNFAKSNSYITRLAMWSLARDNGSCAGQGFASAICSAISQSNFQFSSIFEAF
jgi:chitinase